MHSPILEPAHGHGLSEDLDVIASRFLARRRALTRLASTAGALFMLDACGGGDSGSSGTAAAAATGSTSGATGTTATTGSTATTGTTATTATSGTTTTTTTSSSSGSCVADPTETSGPYPADGTNASQGSTSDVLTASGIVRADIRSSFIGSATMAQGVPVVLTLKLVNTNASCAALAGYAIYLWHCDRTGNYSLYSGAPTESYLRGVQVTDSLGQVTFTTIFPACYSGRWPHMHFEVFTSLSSATTGRNAVLTSQLALPSDACSTVYAGATGYSQSVTNLRAVTLASDGVFGDNSAAQLAAMTPTMTGSVSAGYVASATIGVAR